MNLKKNQIFQREDGNPFPSSLLIGGTMSGNFAGNGSFPRKIFRESDGIVVGGVLSWGPQSITNELNITAAAVRVHSKNV